MSNNNNNKVGKSCDLGFFFFFGVGGGRGPTNTCDLWVDATLLYFLRDGLVLKVKIEWGFMRYRYSMYSFKF